LNKLV